MMWSLVVSAIAAVSSIVGPAVPVAETYAPAVRLNPPAPPPTAPPASPCDQAALTANSLTYEYMNLDPVKTNYRAVASACMGWTPDQVSRWEYFIVHDVIYGESGGCPNIMGRGVVQQAYGCVVSYPNGMATDAGFFQLISIWYGPGRYLCTTFEMCGRDAIIGSPFTSMLAGLRVIEHDGSRPWCYDARARAYHRGCATVPRHFG